MISTLLLDAGGTLVMPNFKRMADAYAEDGVVVAADALAKAEAKTRLDFDTPDFVRRHADPWLSYMGDIAANAGLEFPLTAAFERLRSYHDRENLWEEVIPGTVDALEALSRRFRLGVVSNANGTVRKAFTRLGLSRFFETIVDSQEEGVEKPDPRIFETALERMRVSPAETLYVGDIFKVDVLGARGAGMRGILIDLSGVHADKPCERVASLAELAALLA